VGEELAAMTLVRLGYTIVERRYRTERGDIDIVAEDGETLVFVEVRARANADCGTAADSVTDQKKRQVARMAREYLSVHDVNGRVCRFDVVAVDRALSPDPEVTLYRDAFDAT
jgi:putative endonuclease